MMDGASILYQTEVGRAQIQRLAMNGTKLTPEATCKEFLQVRTQEGSGVYGSLYDRSRVQHTDYDNFKTTGAI